MSLKLLQKLNGTETGSFNKFLNKYKNGPPPRIAWYPSSGIDFRALLYLHPNYSIINPATKTEPDCPDIFLFTDYFPWQDSTFLDDKLLFDDKRTKIYIDSIEVLPRLELPLDIKIVHFPKGSTATNRVVFLMINITSNKLGDFSFPVLYVFAENEAFCSEILIPNKAKLSHIIHVRYGGGCGGGGNASGIWLLNLLKRLECEVFITDNHYAWQSGDIASVKLYPNLAEVNDPVELDKIRVINSEVWSSHGDVTWCLVSETEKKQKFPNQ